MAVLEHPRRYPLKSGGEGIIRSAEWRDAEAFIEHRTRTWDEAPSFGVTNPHEHPVTIAQQVERIESVRASEGDLWLGAVIDGKIVGGLLFTAGNRLRTAHFGILGISVDKAHWGRGTGAALIDALLAWAAAHPVIEKVGLCVFATNTRAIGLYTKMGFQEESRRFGELKYETGEYVTDIQMSRWVKPDPRLRA